MTADDLDRHYRHLLEQAVTRLDASEAALAAASRAASEPLAIVGAACRLPGGIDSTDALWAALHTATDAVTEVPAERWSNDEYCDPDPEAAGFTCSRWGGFLDDVAGFEPGFFGLTPREAQHMDPQQRLLLELAWHALEDACIPVSGLSGSDTGVAIGISSHDYFDLSTRERTQIGPFTGAGTSVSVAAGRLAYGFGFQGPALAVDTACSSSLAAVHIACTMLRGGECDLALAGGVHLQLTPALRLIESRLGAHSPTGRCRSFDAHADGIVTSEGAGLVVLERLSDARANGHRIRALVRGSAVNQDGRSSGLTVPNGPAQEAVLRNALRRAGIAPASVGYVEAHGAGTPLGDPIEAGALSAVYGAGRPRDAPVPIGSIKSNLGHLGAAAGIAGLLKVLVAIEHGRIPTQLHCDEPTPAVDWDGAGLRVVTEECALEPVDDGRVAAISSFGFSGTNAHAILQEAPAGAGAAAPGAGVHLLALSARTLPALTAQVTRLRRHLAATPIALADLCRSANLGRDHFARRAAFVVRTPDELDAALGSFDPDDVVDGPARAPRVAFVFPGQGNQYGRMAQELLDTEPVFRAAIDRCDAALGGLVPRSLAALLDTDEHDPDLHRTSVLQPLLVGLGYALSECWAAWGVRPAWVLGHSAGELSAACAAGVLPLRDALSLAVARGRLMETLTVEGGMALVTCDRALLDDVLDRHGPRVAVAGYNGPRQWVLSSERAALDDCLAELAGAGAGVRVLPGAIPGHTPYMTPIADGMRAAASAVNASAPWCRFASTLTGRIEDEVMTRPQYWVDEVLQPVRFRQAVDSVVADGCDIFLELGPGASLVSMVAEWVTDRTLLTSLQRGKRPAEHLHRGLAELYRRGCAVDWQRYCGDRGGRFGGLPGYAFQRERCWLPDAPQRFSPTSAGVATNGAAAPAHPLLGHARTTVLAQPGQALYEQVLRSSAPAYLCDHRVGGHVVYPAAAFVEMALAAARTGMRTGAIHLRDIAIDRALLLGDEHVTVQTLVEEVAPQTLRVRVFSAPGDGAEGWIAHFEAYVTAHEPPVPALDGWAVPGDASAGALREHYERMAAGGLTVGASFRAIRGLEAGPDGGTVRLQLPLQAGGADGYCLHPVLLDASLQGASLVLGDAAAGLVYLPTGIDALSLLSEPGDELVCHAARRPAGACERAADGEVVIDADIRTPSGRPVATVRGLRLRAVPTASLAAAARLPAARLYGIAWRETDAREGAARAPGAAEILVAGGKGGHGPALAATLRAHGCTVGEVTVPGELRERLAALAAAGRAPAAIACICGDETAGAAQPPDDAARATRTALESVRAIAELGLSPSLWLVTAGARRAVDGDAVDGLALAPVWGVAHVVTREHPELACRAVDLDPAAIAPSIAALAGDIAGALAAADEPGEDRIAYRAGRRLVERVVALVPQASPEARLQLDPGAGYVVSGGLAGLGLATAEWLADRGARRLALVGRSDPSAGALQRIAALQERGVAVLARTGDVADEPRMGAILAELRAGGHPLRGVVHAAGVLQDGVIRTQSWEAFETVLRPKVAGSWVLHRLTLGDPLDLFVLFSSAVVLLGAPGQANHSAANHFLDALAHHRRASGLPALAVDWAGWEHVSHATTDEARERMAAIGMRLLEAGEAFGVLERLLASTPAQAGVMPIDWARFGARFGRAPLHRDVIAEAEPAVRATPAIVETLRALPPAQRRGALAEHVNARMAKVMGLTTAIDPTARLGDLGVDSLMAVELRNALSASLGCPLRSTLLFDFPTIDELTGHIGADVLDLWPGEPAPAAEQAHAEIESELDALGDDELNDIIDRELHVWQSRRTA